MTYPRKRHPNSRERRTYPPLASDMTLGQFKELLSRYHNDDMRVAYFKVKIVTPGLSTSTYEPLHPDDIDSEDRR